VKQSNAESEQQRAMNGSLLRALLRIQAKQRKASTQLREPWPVKRALKCILLDILKIIPDQIIFIQSFSLEIIIIPILTEHIQTKAMQILCNANILLGPIMLPMKSMQTIFPMLNDLMNKCYVSVLISVVKLF
jgi:hypothetical protein